MVSPRLESLDRVEQGLAKLQRRTANTFRAAKLIAVDANGFAQIEISGRFGKANVERVTCMLDSPERYIGLNVWVVNPSGNLSNGAVVMGVWGPAVAVTDTTVLSPVQGLFLEGRDRALLGDTDAWRGQGRIPASETLVIEEVVLVIESVNEGTPVLRLGDRHFREAGYDGQVYTLRPREPFRIQADADADAGFTMTLSVDRLGATQLNDAVVTLPYTVEGQAAGRLPLSTIAGVHVGGLCGIAYYARVWPHVVDHCAHRRIDPAKIRVLTVYAFLCRVPAPNIRRASMTTDMKCERTYVIERIEESDGIGLGENPKITIEVLGTSIEVAEDKSKATISMHGEPAGEVTGPINGWWIKPA